MSWNFLEKRKKENRIVQDEGNGIGLIAKVKSRARKKVKIKTQKGGNWRITEPGAVIWLKRKSEIYQM
jgi:hypothetical protein